MMQSAQTAAMGVRDFVQYIADAAAVGAFAFAWRTNTRVTRLETILTEPKTGVVDIVSSSRSSLHRQNNDLSEHEIRLDNHDREIERLDRDKEPRRSVQLNDVGALDRRSTL